MTRAATRRRVGSAVLLALAARTATLAAQDSTTAHIRGTIRDSVMSRVSYVSIHLSTGKSLRSDETGAFDFLAPRGAKVSFELRRIGYEPATIALPAAGDTALDVFMRPIARQLEAVKVAERQVHGLTLTGFYSRLQDHDHGANTGVFITPEELEFRHPLALSQVLQGIQGLVISRAIGTVGVKGPNAGKMIAYGQRGCQMETYIDGARTNIHLTTMTDTMNYIDDLLPAMDIGAIEVYNRGTKAPSRFQTLNGSCGVILIWTKRGG